MLVVLGQDLPDLTSGVASQVFAVSSAVVGLASFALVLALMEQVGWQRTVQLVPCGLYGWLLPDIICRRSSQLVPLTELPSVRVMLRCLRLPSVAGSPLH